MINCQHHDKKKYVQLLSDSCPSFIRSVNYYEKIFIFHGKFDITCGKQLFSLVNLLQKQSN